MRSLRSGLFGVTIAGVIGTFAVVGCTADGAADDLLLDPASTPIPTEPEDGNRGSGSSVLPPSSSSGGEGSQPVGDAGKDASKPDKPDAGKDTGPSAPAEGDPCPTPNAIFKRSCGLCGTQEAICLSPGNGGANYVSPYGECTGQVVDGCMPGTVEEAPCGNCGTQARTCNQYCAWSTGSCQNQPTNHCTPGSVELLSAGCPSDKYRQKSCKADCTWDNVSLTCSEPPSYVLVPPTPGSVNSTIAVLRSNQTTGRLGLGSCPLTSAPSSTQTPYAYIEVRNPNPKAVTVSIFNSQATPTSPVIDTIMAAYDGAAIPTTDTQRKNCTKGVGDFGTTALTGDSNFASLDGARAVTIAAGASVQVYFASYPAFSSSNPSNSTGMVKLNVRTESVAP